jgi:hypothetical protein
MDHPKKITPEISNYIETFSLLYSTLTNEVTATSVNQNRSIFLLRQCRTRQARLLLAIVAEAQFRDLSSLKSGATADDGKAIQEETFGPKEDKTFLELVDRGTTIRFVRKERNPTLDEVVDARSNDRPVHE